LFCSEEHFSQLIDNKKEELKSVRMVSCQSVAKHCLLLLCMICRQVRFWVT